METLPDEVLIKIFTNFGEDNLVLGSCQLVCKRWRGVLLDQHFLAEIWNKNYQPKQITCEFRSLKNIYLIKIRVEKLFATADFATRIQLAQALEWLDLNCNQNLRRAILSQVHSNQDLELLKKILVIAVEKDSFVNILEDLMFGIQTNAKQILVNLLINGRSLLHTAAYFSNFRAVKWLVENNANLEQNESRFRQTPLAVAAQRSSFEVFEFMLNRNCNVEAVDKDFMSIFTLAQLNSDLRVKEYLNAIQTK